MAKPLPSVDAIVARVKELAEDAMRPAPLRIVARVKELVEDAAIKTAADSTQTYTDTVADSLQKLANELRTEVTVSVSVQDVLDFTQAVNR